MADQTLVCLGLEFYGGMFSYVLLIVSFSYGFIVHIFFSGQS